MTPGRERLDAGPSKRIRDGFTTWEDELGWTGGGPRMSGEAELPVLFAHGQHNRLTVSCWPPQVPARP
jgi:hypothetical protein